VMRVFIFPVCFARSVLLHVGMCSKSSVHGYGREHYLQDCCRQLEIIYARLSRPLAATRASVWRLVILDFHSSLSSLSLFILLDPSHL
jgi:hypothetical protein